MVKQDFVCSKICILFFFKNINIRNNYFKCNLSFRLFSLKTTIVPTTKILRNNFMGWLDSAYIPLLQARIFQKKNEKTFWDWIIYFVTGKHVGHVPALPRWLFLGFWIASPSLWEARPGKMIHWGSQLIGIYNMFLLSFACWYAIPYKSTYVCTELILAVINVFF